ncbi:MAG: enoyl-CoA hydratase [Gammaproteobacteria bacterium]|nr:enoyl-CoA hydratase [Gammaproteobacteria bacterium]
MSLGVEVQRHPRAPGEVVVFVLHGRTALNVVGSESLRAGTATIRRAAQDPKLRCAVLAGPTPDSFIGGADLKELGALTTQTAEAFIRSIHDFCTALREFPTPVIARIAGHCLGGGLEIAVACDLRVAASDSRFGMPEVRLGVPSVVEAALLPTLIGWGRTRELLLRGHLIEAQTAQAIGLVEQVASPAMLEASLDRVIDDLLAGAPGAIRAQKKLLQRWEQLPLDEAIEAGVAAFVASYETAEPATYCARFFARRRPE